MRDRKEMKHLLASNGWKIISESTKFLAIRPIDYFKPVDCHHLENLEFMTGCEFVCLDSGTVLLRKSYE